MADNPEKIDIIAQNESWIIINKPAFIDSQNSREGRASVVDFLKKKFEFSGLVHRLDFGTSGLMVCAKNESAAKKLSELFIKQKIKRCYQAVCLKAIQNEDGVFDSNLDEKKALTRFVVLERFLNATLVEVELETGRKHQIRRHFSEAGYPLLGDHLYSKNQSKLLFERPALHAFRLTIENETYECELPPDFQKLLNRLRGLKARPI